MKTKKNLISKLAVFALATACASSVEMNKNLMNMEPGEAIQTAQQSLDEARGMQAGIFAKDLMEEGEEHLSEAFEELSERDREEAIEHAAYADAYFQKAINNSRKDSTAYAPVLEARKAATASNLYSVEELRDKLSEIDDDLIDETDDFSDSLRPKEIAEFQERYLDLEGEAVEYRNLNNIKMVIDNMEDRDADELAPISYTNAVQSYLVAKNLVRQNPREPEAYTGAVLDAKSDAIMLGDVMDVIESDKNPAPERIAIRQVESNRALSSAKERLGLYENTMELAGDRLDSQNSKLMSLESQLDFQRAMEEIQSKFSANEAEVYQQGNKLIVRLKEVGFDVGSASIPSNSQGLLKKVAGVIQNIDAKNIEVQGHTDTTGSEKINEELSEKRASEVATYMKNEGVEAPVEAKGYASKNPITNNLTAENRKLNRRVDVVITARAPSDEFAE